ncbi:hypothetical protein DUI87_32783 [Hirundo rustica rustica]|uniref:Peptidase A2 domain-containing protein n=1 Tax=Hirundo rustica rustica TaxID=333673 RepID=A0A3M0IWC6_HIRRU|nr:hypothetical protein DUI87_32783 [Hirundo rustica rustica]
MSAALPRPQGDPLIGLTMDELMGQGPFHRIEAQRRLCPVRIRKLQNQREVGPRQDTSSSSCSADNQLVPATSGSLGLDLAAAVTVTLFNNSPHVISTGVFGPIIVNGQPTGGLILGRSSGSVLGLFIEPGVVDADSEGEIFVIASTPHPPMKILKGQRIAQFVPLPQLTANILPRSKEPRSTGCLGSSGAITLPVIDLSTRPKRTCHLHYQGQTATLHKALLDTGADTCIVDLTKYPKMWPLLSSNTTVSGIGGIRLAQRSPLLTVEVDDKLAKAVFSLTPLPAEVDCILGRDVLTQLGLIHPVIQGRQMTAMPIDPDLAAKGKPNPLMVLKARPTDSQKKGLEEISTEHKETTLAQEMLTKFEKECENLDAAWEMLEKLEAEMRERENLNYWEYRRN